MQMLITKMIIAVADAGKSGAVYSFFHALSLLVAFSLAAWYGKKMKVGAWRVILLVVMGFSASYIWMYLFHWILSGFQHFGGQNHVTAIVYEPLLYLLPAKLLKIEGKKYCSMLSVGTPIMQGIGHIGCIFPGCCEGYPAEWGIFNISTGVYHVPNQLIEAAVAIAIALYMMHRIKKRGYEADAKDCPLMLIMFGLTRFLLEFLRNNEKLWLGCSDLAFHALFMALVGAAALVIIRKKKNLALSEAVSK